MTEQGNMNIDQQKGSYDAFVKLFTWVTVGLVIVLAVMAATLV